MDVIIRSNVFYNDRSQEQYNHHKQQQRWKKLSLHASDGDDSFNFDNFDPEQMIGEGGQLGEQRELSDEELAETMGEWDDKVARFNTVHLTGRLGSTPEARYLDDGKVVVTVSIAVKRRYHYIARKCFDIASGQEETDWYRLEAWGATAEFINRYVDKGSRVGVIGTLEIDEWIDKETGEPRSYPKVIVRDFEVLESKAEAELRRSNRGGEYGGGGRGGGGGGGPAFYSSDDKNNDGTGGFFDQPGGVF